MSWVSRVVNVFRGDRLNREIDEELQSHLEEAREAGRDPAEARDALGSRLRLREESRDARGLPRLDVLRQDARYTLRALRRDRTFALVAVLILGLGIGANIAVFSVVDTLLLRPLPFPAPGQLVRILSKNTAGGESSMTYSADAAEEFQQRNRSFQAVSGYFAFSGPDNLKLIGQDQPQPVTGLEVMGNFLSTLGIEPALGRLFRPEECHHSSLPVALLSHAFWERKFNADPALVGRTINLSGTATTVIGVLPDMFDFGAVFSPGTKIDLYTPAILDDMRDWGNTMALVGRLRPEVRRSQAQAEADLLFPKLDFNVKHPEWGGGYTARVLGLKDYVSGKLRRSLIVLWCAVGMILLIVCVNLSNLLLGRAAARSKEFAMRSALGAGRARLVRQMLTESLILSAGGALLGLGLAFAVTRYLAHQGSIALPLLGSVRVDGAALGWTLLVAVLAAILFGLTPGLKISSGNLQEALKDSGHGSSAGRKHEALRAALVISEVALASVLLVGSGLLLRSFLRILDVDVGFEPSHAALISVESDDGGDAAKRGAIWQDIIRRVEALPGVETAGISDNVPMSTNRSWGIAAKGRTYRQGELEATFVYMVSPGYLHALGIRLVQGRDISWDDGPKNQRVVIINETVARRLWPGEDPVGRMALVNANYVQVIGVAADIHESNVESLAGWQMYLPATQWGPVGCQLVVRTKLPPEALAASVMKTLREINPGQPATPLRPLQQLVDHVVSPRRFFVILVGAFALLGLTLASLGIYGVIAYSVTQRTQEIGIRMALGASPGSVQRGVIERTLKLALVGIATGTMASLIVARLISSLLYGTAASDPLVFAGMILLLGSVAFLAGYLPARRASRIDPLMALRNE